MKYGCASCAKPMDRVSIPGRGRYYSCADHGVWFQRSFFHAYEGGKTLAREILGSPKAASARERKLACPQCFAKMSVVGFRPRPGIELDACHRCEAIWFDSGELEQIDAVTMKSAGGSPVSQPVVPGEERVRFAPSEHLYGSGQLVGEGRFSFLHVLGLPTEESFSRPQREIVLTYFLILLSLLLTLVAFKNHAILVKWAFLPTQPLKNFGLNSLVSLFMHADWFQWFTNAYFLYLAGDNIEDQVGRGRLLELFIFGGLCGHVASVFLGPTLPVLGASGSIAALLAYYVCAFPKNRLHFSSRTRRWGPLISYSLAPSVVFLFYFASQILGLAFQIHRGAGSQLSFQSSLNYAAQVGGILGGFLYFSVMPGKRES